MPLQVVIAVEALRALVALERPVVLRVGLRLGMAVELLHVRCVSAVECWDHLTRHASNECHLVVRVADVGQNRTGHGVLKGTLVGVWGL